MGLEETASKEVDYSGEKAKKKKILIIGGAVVGVIIVGVIIYLLWPRKTEPVQEEVVTLPEVVEEPVIVEEPAVVLATSYLNGEQIDPAIATRRPLAIVVENHSASRPPTGLIEADIVYEMPVEAGPVMSSGSAACSIGLSDMVAPVLPRRAG